MPASRSRTERWRDCLDQIRDRGGSIEISLDTGDGRADPSNAVPVAPGTAPGAGPANLVWRVRLVSVTDAELLVERPMALGRAIDLSAGSHLVAAMAIGQNRWMFRTSVLGPAPVAPPGSRPGSIIRISAPDAMERCSRRAAFRVSTAEIRLPEVECWPLLDPTTVVAAEVANRELVTELLASGGRPHAGDVLMPEVGPKFKGRLLNIGGGGAGLLFDPAESKSAESTRLYWVRIHLEPDIPAPISVTARLAHTHLDSSQNVYAGLAFEFGFNPSHKDFISGVIARYVSSIEARQQAGRRAAG